MQQSETQSSSSATSAALAGPVAKLSGQEADALVTSQDPEHVSFSV